MQRTAIAASLLALGACTTVGPDYAGSPSVASTEGDGDFARAGPATTPREPQLAAWWSNLGDPVLDRLEEQALAGNPDLAIARARIAEARAALGGVDVQAYPDASAVAAAAHVRIPGLNLEDGASDGEAAGTTSTTVFNLGLNTSWEIDLFGGHRRQVEASLADVQVGLTSAVARSYVGLRGVRERIGITERAVADRKAMLTLERQLFGQGVVPAGRVDEAEQALAAARRQVLLLRADADRFLNALAVLVGEAPGAVDEVANGFSPPPLPPAQVEIGDPGDLLARRPDIRAAERQMAAANARIGIAKAAGLPRLSFLGLLGIGGTSPDDLSRLDDFTAIAAPMLQWNFLDFGRNEVKISGAEARAEAAAAEYRKTVLGALQEVEDGLAAFRYRRQEIAELARIEASAASRLDRVQQRFDRGVASRLEVLAAALRHKEAEQALAQGRTALTLDFISIENALGLGWQ
jgi:NodT family efflux transporter outer membrane factor (OMF) lipoprotein